MVFHVMQHLFYFKQIHSNPSLSMVVTKVSKINQAWQTFSVNGSHLVYKFLVLLLILLFNSLQALFGTFLALLHFRICLKRGLLRIRVRQGYGKALSCVSSWWVISSKKGEGYESAIALIFQLPSFLPCPHPSNCKVTASAFFTGYFQQTHVHILEAITAD